MSDNITETKKAKIGLAIGMNYRLGPHRSMDISSHVYQDDSIEEINAIADKIAEVAARQQAKAELDEFYEALRQETKRHSEAKQSEAKFHQEYTQKVKLTNEALEEEVNRIIAKFSGYKTPQAEQGRKVKEARDKIEKVLSEMTLKYQADCSNHKVNILTLEERINDVNRSISRREAIVSGSKKGLKLVNEG